MHLNQFQDIVLIYYNNVRLINISHFITWQQMALSILLYWSRTFTFRVLSNKRKQNLFSFYIIYWTHFDREWRPVWDLLYTVPVLLGATRDTQSYSRDFYYISILCTIWYKLVCNQRLTPLIHFCSLCLPNCLIIIKTIKT